MKYLIVFKLPQSNQNAFTSNNAVACAMRTLCKITKKKYFENDMVMMCQCPDQPGDSTKVARFYQNYPKVIINNNDFYDENEACEYYLNECGGTRQGVGHSLVTDLCYDLYMQYTLVNKDKIDG